MTKPGENALLKKFLLEHSKLGSRLFRNNVGMAWTGQTNGPIKDYISVSLSPGDLVIRKARPFHAGHPKGSPDLIGWTTIEITPNLVGQKIAVYTAIEAKTEHVSATKEQKQFIKTVLEAGGIATIARKFEDVLKAISIFKSKTPKEDNANETRH